MNSYLKKIANAIINCFETGSPRGNYASVEVLPDGAGITYGRAGVTDRQDNLDAVVMRYLEMDGIFSNEFRPYLGQLADPRMPLTDNATFKALLKKAALRDPIMVQAQDWIFDHNYFIPSQDRAIELQLKLPLSQTLVFDAYIQGSFDRVRALFPERVPLNGGDEKKWAIAYVVARRNWLAKHPKKILHNTVYRMDCFRAMIKADNWNLDLPIVANGVKITDKDV